MMNCVLSAALCLVDLGGTAASMVEHLLLSCSCISAIPKLQYIMQGFVGLRCCYCDVRYHTAIIRVAINSVNLLPCTCLRRRSERPVV